MGLSGPIVILQMGGHLVGGHGWFDQSLSNRKQLVLSTPWCCAPSFNDF
jgi:Cu+-exporting ATPase